MDEGGLTHVLLDYQRLKTIETVAQAGSISCAAKSLFISQQGLSKSIQAIEHDLGVRLFDHTGQGVELTEIGEKILPIAKTAAKQFEFYAEIIYDIILKEKSSFTFAFEHAYMPFAVPPELLSRDAGIAVKTKICSGRQERIDAVLSGDADLGPCSHAHDLGGLRWRPFVTEPVQFLMNSDNALARKEYLTLDDLRNADHVLPLGNIVIINDYIDVCLAHGFYPSFVYEASDFNLLVRNVMTNNVVQITASFALTEHSSNRLVLKPLKHEGLVAEYGFVFDPDRLTLPMRSFVNAMLSYYGAEQ